MKRIFINGILSIVICISIIYFLPNDHESTLINIICAFCIFTPIGVIYSNINGYLKNKRFRGLGINYNSDIPCYLFIGLYELTQEKYREIKKSSSLTYAICLSSRDTLYFYECEKSLMTAEKFKETSCDEVGGSIISINKSDVIQFYYRDLNRDATDRVTSWLANKLAGALQGYFTNRVQQKVAIDAIVELYFIQNNAFKVLTFGIPESMASSFSIDLISLLPEIVEKAHGYISDCVEVAEDLENDPVHVKKAKNMIRKFIKVLQPQLT